MLEELNREIMEAQEQARRGAKLRNDLNAVGDSLRRERARLAKLAAGLEQEGADVARLEGMSLAGLFYTILGSKDDQLAKERQEYLAAKLKHDECRAAVTALEGEVQQLRQELEALGDVEGRYRSLMDRKETALKEAGDERAARLISIAEELAGARADERELGEAIAAADAALAGLQEMVKALNSASNWGMWDLLGGGTLATLAKHSRLDEARGAAYRVQQLLRRFQRELADVAASESDLAVDVGSFATFADFFFDGLIADWVVQSRMAKSLENATRVQGRVATVRRQLQRRLAATRRKAAELAAERQRLIAEA